jgi:hypothetical protein
MLVVAAKSAGFASAPGLAQTLGCTAKFDIDNQYDKPIL